MHNALLPCSVTRALLAYAYCDNNEGEHIADCLPLPNQDPSRMLGQDLQQPCTIYAQANYRTPLALVVAGEGEHVADSPYPIKILPGPSSARHSTVSGPGRYAATAGATADFSVQVKDASGNGYEMMEESAEGLLDLQAQLLGSNTLPVAAVVIKPTAGGCYQCSYTAPAAAGLYVLEVTANGRHLRGSPFSVKVASTDLWLVTAIVDRDP
eukprot:GHUV01039218.1.p1 GENE.GHUV01039218.1~~GHUV01039218.1.p1  ORF type:complete len:211 (+),score=52.32 GHUV01039218.1:306-938(+)